MNPKIDLAQMPEVADAATAEAFIRWCCRNIGPAFHPDTGFQDYIEADGSHTFTDEEAALLDARLTAVFKFVADPYAIGLAEFAAMRAEPTTPAAGPGPVKGMTMLAKVILSRRTDRLDAVLSAFEAARLQLHLREARAMPGLAVVKLPVGEIEPDEPDHEAKLHAASNTDRFAVNGDRDRIIEWLRKLAEMGVAEFWYDIELPPDAAWENDANTWAGWLADRLDQPGVRFNVRVCTDQAEWQVGLTPAC